ncbi:MAG: ATP-binding cassette domain-containing protein [Myxococcales bacterium]|nr:ATP-binding cassette domain-containing protein [Myxococcales bacterium]
MSGRPYIELCGVDVAYEEDLDAVLLRGVDWRIQPGEWWVVAGHPGRGKTSLLSTCAALVPPVAGTLRVFGRDYWDASERHQIEWRQRIGMVFDGGGRLFSHMNLLENVLLPLEYHLGLDREAAVERAGELLARVGLADEAHLRPSRLNSADRQRVALARTLALPLRVLFIDNPLAGLPPEEVRWWLEFLRDLRTASATDDETLAIVASTYDFGAWLARADHFATIEGEAFKALSPQEARGIEPSLAPEAGP